MLGAAAKRVEVRTVAEPVAEAAPLARGPWIVEAKPEASIRALRLSGERYDEVALATGEEQFSVQEPVPVTVQPADLLR